MDITFHRLQWGLLTNNQAQGHRLYTKLDDRIGRKLALKPKRGRLSPKTRLRLRLPAAWWVSVRHLSLFNSCSYKRQLYTFSPNTHTTNANMERQRGLKSRMRWHQQTSLKVKCTSAPNRLLRINTSFAFITFIYRRLLWKQVILHLAARCSPSQMCIWIKHARYNQRTGTFLNINIKSYITDKQN